MAVYDYESVAIPEAKEELQRFGKILVEATSFTISEPVAKYTIAPLLYDYATEENKKIFREQYGVAPFEIETIQLERIFIDKIFAAEFYFQRQSLFDVAKHAYDLTILSGLDSIKALFCDKEKLGYLISLKRREEAIRKGGVPEELAIKDFKYFADLESDDGFEAAYRRMQTKYVLNAADEINPDEVIATIKVLHEKLTDAI
jgi:hypothetical protein